MDRFIFSGNMPKHVPDILRDSDGFESMSLLCTQLKKERGVLKKYLELKEEGLCDFLMIDSGAYPVFTGTAETTVDEYLEFIERYDDVVDIFVELDTIPGKWRQSKKPEDYIESAEKSWETFIYMYSRVPNPKKLMPVFHSGEPFAALKRMLDWEDVQGNKLEYIGISAAKDANNKNRDTYLSDVTQVIQNSLNPNVKTHLFGTTAFSVLREVPCYSCDSTTHVRLAGFGGVISKNFGIIQVSSKGMEVGKSNHFMATACESNMKLLEEELEPLHLTFEDIKERSAARCALNMYNTLDLTKTVYAYDPKFKKSKKRLI